MLGFTLRPESKRTDKLQMVPEDKHSHRLEVFVAQESNVQLSSKPKNQKSIQITFRFFQPKIWNK